MDERPHSNKTSNINEHLANERTFLAWVRTSIATISLGFVIARFSFWLREIAIATGQKVQFPHTGLSLPIGLGMVAFGALMMLMAILRYFDIRRAIELGAAHPRPVMIVITSGVVVLLAIVLIIYLLTASQQF
jgi:putative membrane protein